MSTWVSAIRCVCVFQILAGALAAEDDTALRGQFLKAIRETDGRIGQLSFRASCTRTSKYTSLSAATKEALVKAKADPNAIQSESFECAIRGPFGSESGVRREGIRYVVAKNGTYAFRLERSTTLSKPTLRFVEQLGADPSVDQQIEQADTESRVVILGQWYVNDTPLRRLVESSNFKIHKISSLQKDGSDLVRVDFEHLTNDPKRKTENITNGYLICDASRHWLLREYSTLRGYAIHQVTIDFGPSVQDVPIPKTITRTISYKNDPETIRNIVFTIDVLANDVPESEFFLSHYGLPEPNLGGSWLSVWGWYFVGGIAFIVIGTVIIKWRNRTRL